MAEVAVVVEDVLNKTQKTKLVLLSGTPTTTSDVITFDQSTSGPVVASGGGFSKVMAAWAHDSSTGMPKAISGNGSTVLTTRGFAASDNKWFIFVVLKNDFGEVA